MSYQPSYRKRRSGGWKSALSTLVLSLCVMAAFAGAVYLFRKKDVPAPPPKTEAVPVAAVAPVVPDTTITDTTADLVDQHTGAKVGTATRGIKDGLFDFTITMNPPTPIDRTAQAYVVWLLRPLPFDFFPLGEMVTDATGAFVMDWTGEKDKDYSGYTRVLIMLAPKGQTPPDPGAPQVIKGVFGSP